MSNELQIYRKRLIPEECILLKDDIIVEQNEDYILTKWKTLNPKTTFSHGCSCYYLKEGFKISTVSYTHLGIFQSMYTSDTIRYLNDGSDIGYIQLGRISFDLFLNDGTNFFWS